jgi:hypothetical protein
VAVIQEAEGLPLSNQAKSDKRRVVTLWISDTNGSHAQMAGCFFSSASSSGVEMGNRLKWLPDGKTLSFVYQHELYTVPANGPDFSQFVAPSANRSK